MKRLTLFVLLFTVNFIVRGQQLPNGDFENWVSQPYGEEPIDWGEYNTQVYNLIFPGLIDSTVVKSTDAYSGSYALEMRSKTYSYLGSVDTVAPFVMLNLKNANIDSAFLEINSNLLSISGYIKQNLVNVDSNYTGITVMVFSNGNQEGVGSLIFDSSITNYTFFDVPIVYSGVPNGDSIEIYLFGGNSNYAIPGNIVKLDGLQLNYITNTPIIYGCTDSSSLNFDPLATVDDGSCVPIIFGCTTLNDTVCDSYTWNGNTFNTSGTYNNPSGSCVDTLNLVVNYSSSSYMSTIACNEYVWNGNAITVTGLYFNTSTNSDGCPQYDSLDLTVDNSTFGTDLIKACDSYTWIDGITYTSTNNSAQDTLVNTYGCDSIVTLDLTINYSSSSYSTLSSCNSYDWNGQTYTSNGLYINFSTNQSGCPQTDTLDLTITTSGTAVNDTVCDSYSWKGNTINTSGTYFNSNGSCLEILNLVVDYTSNSYLNIVACDEFITNGNTYTSSGIYYDTLQTLHGCDSSVTLDLTVNYTSSSLNTVISCNDYLWNGDLYTSSGFYIDTLQSISGCDSLATLSIIIKEVTVDTITVNSCDFYFWRGNTYNQSGIYRDTLQSVLGCDSILLLDLILDNPTFTNDSVTSCQHYLWNGNNYTLSGIYTDSLFSLNGCDSIVTLSLTIINSFQGDTLEISTCDEFLWQGNQYSQTGLFSDTLISNIGCDSIIYLNLTINNSFEIDEYVNACISYNWNGKTYNVSGVYTDTLEAPFGCDSIINLNLNISNNQIFSDTIVSCDSYLWNGLYLDSSGQYIDTLQSIGGCDSTIILDLTIYEIAFVNDSVNNCEYYDWNGVRYTSSGVYLDTIQSSSGCDSIVSLDLNLFTVYQDTIFASACDSFLWYGNTYTVPGIYTNTFITINGCDSIEVLNFSINNNNNNSPIEFELVLDDYCLETYWNIVSSDRIVVHQGGPYDCNINGSGLQSNQTINRSLSLEEQGCYTFTLYDDFGDGLGASQWGGVDGSWLLNDLNGNYLSQGQGNFGDSISVSFYINEDFSTSIIENENNFSKIIAYPNPFVDETEIQIINFEGVYDVSIRDIQGKIIFELNNLSDNYFTLKSSSISRGAYWVVLDNHPTIKPLKLVVQ